MIGPPADFRAGVCPTHCGRWNLWFYRCSWQVCEFPKYFFEEVSKLWLSWRNIRANLHYDQGLWSWNCKGPWNSSEGRTMDNWNWTLCRHRPTGVVWRHMQMGSQPNAILLTSKSCRRFHNISHNKSRVLKIQSVMVSWFHDRSTSVRWASCKLQ